jgi:hypothetical protein
MDPSQMGAGGPMPPGGDPAMAGMDPTTGMPLGMPPPGDPNAAPTGAPGTDPMQMLTDIMKEIKELRKDIADMKRDKLHQSTDKLHGEVGRLVDLLSRAADSNTPEPAPKAEPAMPVPQGPPL